MPPTSRGSGSLLERLMQLTARRPGSSSSSSSNYSTSSCCARATSHLPSNLPAPHKIEKTLRVPKIAKDGHTLRHFTGAGPPHASSSPSPEKPFNPPPPPDAPIPGRRTSRRLGPYMRIFVAIMFSAVPIVIVAFNHMPYQAMTVRGASMTPFLNGAHVNDEPNTDDKVLVHVQFPLAKLKRGMVVVFRSPNDPEKVVIKRVVAVAGDRVWPTGPHTGSDDEEEKVAGGGKEAENGGESSREIIVPFGHVFVEGDTSDRAKSLDSNWYGSISLNLIIGVVTRVIYPWNRIAAIHSEHWRPNIITSSGTPTAGAGAVIELDAVQLNHPDEDNSDHNIFRDDHTAEAILKVIQQPGKKDEMMQTLKGQKGMRDLYRRAKKEIARNDPETVQLATEILDELDNFVPAPAVKKAENVGKKGKSG